MAVGFAASALLASALAAPSYYYDDPVIITPRTQAQSPTAGNTTAHTIQPQVHISAMTAADIRARNADIRARNVGASDRSALSATAALNVRPLPLAGISSI